MAEEASVLDKVVWAVQKGIDDIQCEISNTLGNDPPPAADRKAIAEIRNLLLDWRERVGKFYQD